MKTSLVLVLLACLLMAAHATESEGEKLEMVARLKRSRPDSLDAILENDRLRRSIEAIEEDGEEAHLEKILMELLPGYQ